MILNITIEGILTIAGFLLGLVALFISFGIINRTKDEVRYGFIFLFLGLVAFIIFGLVKLLESYQIIIRTVASDVLLMIFILLIIAGMWKLKTLIKGLSDFGQAFVLTSNDKHDDKLVSLLKNTKNVCYVTLNRPYDKVVDLLNIYNIDSF